MNVFTASKGSNLYILFAITAAGVVPCCGPKTSLPYIIHSTDYYISLFRSFEISKDIQSVQNTHVQKHTSKQLLNYLKPFRNVFDLDFSCKFSKLQYNRLAFVAGLNRATDEGSFPEIAQYSPYYLPLNVLLLPKGSNRYTLFTM